ncbi:hypothetical protein IAQ61_007343 [Plenodomus lingam]|uniref:uncharacterized protein n=1 Tax=Leptosphaeria maculans TaxID=5022 RepID=UPI003332523A|nr:hypothetical protein IAQ61_007343 [Plenodomus lingam]
MGLGDAAAQRAAESLYRKAEGSAGCQDPAATPQASKVGRGGEEDQTTAAGLWGGTSKQQAVVSLGSTVA